MVVLENVSPKPTLIHDKNFEVHIFYNFYKFMLLFFISYKHKMSQVSQINIILYVTNVSFSSTTLGRKFKINEYTSFADMQYEVHNLLAYEDSQKIVKLEYRSPSINNKGKIEFNNYEFKTNANVRTMRSTFFRFETNVSI